MPARLLIVSFELLEVQVGLIKITSPGTVVFEIFALDIFPYILSGANFDGFVSMGSRRES